LVSVWIRELAMNTATDARSTGSQSWVSADMRDSLLLLIVLQLLGTAGPALAQDPGRPVSGIGSFSNMRYNDEHAYGYTVELWRDGGSAIGLLFVSEGLMGDTPAGMIENVRFNSRTGALSFDARLSIGVTAAPRGGMEPSRELFEFSGVLEAKALTGRMMRSDPRQPSRSVTRERIALSKQLRTVMFAAGSYAEWKRQADAILTVRGPKW
jgi:hypothetical protein